MSAIKDLSGQRFGRLTVIERSGSTPRGHAKWRCICDCGNICLVEGAKMIQGNTKSCGCLLKDALRERRPKHGKTGTRLYKVWSSMKRRCYIRSHKDYDRYGGRGILVCDEWKTDFQAFYEWSIANGYDETAPRGQCTIDRIDNDKGYSPDNCRWVDIKTQCNNRSHSGPLPRSIDIKKSKKNEKLEEHNNGNRV